MGGSGSVGHRLCGNNGSVREEIFFRVELSLGPLWSLRYIIPITIRHTAKNLLPVDSLFHGRKETFDRRYLTRVNDNLIAPQHIQIAIAYLIIHPAFRKVWI